MGGGGYGVDCLWESFVTVCGQGVVHSALFVPYLTIFALFLVVENQE